MESFAAGASVGTVAVTAFVLAAAATVHNVMVCKRIVEAVVNAKKDKEGEKVGKEGTGEAGKETGDSETKNRKFKKAKSGTGKEKATNVPSWAEGNKPFEDENGKDFAKRLCDEHYGEGNYGKRGQSDYSKIRKWGDRGFEKKFR